MGSKKKYLVDSFNDFLSLIRLGFGGKNTITSASINWIDIKALAERQGLSAVLVDGIEHLPEALRPPKEDLLQMIGKLMQDYESRYDIYHKVIADLAAFYNSHGFRMMILKGYACSLNWPKPEHRPCGDIDIWLFGDYKEADAALKKEKGIEINNDRQHHTVFDWHGFMVENHFDFTDLHHHKSNVEIEKILKELGHQTTCCIDLHGKKIYIPSPNMHALFLLKHTMAHFAAEGMTLRQLLDWGFFVKEYTNEIDWSWLEDVLDKCGMMPAYNIFNAICVDDLGFDSKIFPRIQFNSYLKEKVLLEILSPEFSATLPNNVVSRVIYKIRRWRGNSWKHELCYKDSLWSAFWSGVYNHLRKPATI